MSTTANFKVPHVTEAQSQKHVSINRGFDLLEQTLSAEIAVTMADAEKILTDAESQHLFLNVNTAALTATRNFTVPATEHLYLVKLSSATHAVTFRPSGGTGVAVSDTNYHILYSNVSTMVLVL